MWPMSFIQSEKNAGGICNNIGKGVRERKVEEKQDNQGPLLYVTGGRYYPWPNVANMTKPMGPFNTYVAFISYFS